MTGTKNSRFSSTSYTRKDVSRALDPPPELTDKDLHIKMLCEDLARAEQRQGNLSSIVEHYKEKVAFLERQIKQMAPRSIKYTVKELREENGLSARQLSKTLNFDYSGLCRKEKGEYGWTNKDKKIVANYFGVKVSDIDWGKGHG